MGTGETGMDLAYASIKAGAEEVVLCSRSGCVPFASPLLAHEGLLTPFLPRSFLSFPKVLNNFTLFGTTFDGHLPIDSLLTNLCESA